MFSELAQNLLPIRNYLHMKNQFSPRELYWGNKLLLRIDCILSNRWSAENELNIIHGSSLSHNVMVRLCKNQHKLIYISSDRKMNKQTIGIYFSFSLFTQYIPFVYILWLSVLWFYRTSDCANEQIYDYAYFFVPFVGLFPLCFFVFSCSASLFAF